MPLSEKQLAANRASAEKFHANSENPYNFARRSHRTLTKQKKLIQTRSHQSPPKPIHTPPIPHSESHATPHEMDLRSKAAPDEPTLTRTPPGPPADPRPERRKKFSQKSTQPTENKGQAHENESQESHSKPTRNPPETHPNAPYNPPKWRLPGRAIVQLYSKNRSDISPLTPAHSCDIVNRDGTGTTVLFETWGLENESYEAL
jgi:hypothetical protein